MDTKRWRATLTLLLLLVALLIGLIWAVNGVSAAPGDSIPTLGPTGTLGTPTQYLVPYVTAPRGDIICPTGYPVGWGTVTPSTSWWLLCGSCFYNPFELYPTSEYVPPPVGTATVTPAGGDDIRVELSISGPYQGDWGEGYFSCRNASEEYLLYPPGSIDREGTWLQCQGEVSVSSGQEWPNQWVEINIRLTDPTNNSRPITFWASVDYDIQGGYNTLTNEEYDWQEVFLYWGQQKNAQLKFKVNGTALVYLWGEFFYGSHPQPTPGPTPTLPYAGDDLYCGTVRDSHYEDFYFKFQPFTVLGVYCMQLGGGEILGYEIPGVIICFDIVDFGVLSMWGMSISLVNIFSALTGWFLARRFM